MPRYEYKVVPAPTKGLKGKGVKGAEARFSHALQELMNDLASSGWEYQRAETLPSLERAGLTGTTSEWRNVLVFRRLRENDADVFAPELLPAPAEVPPVPDVVAEPEVTPPETMAEPEVPPKDTPKKTPEPWDNGVENTGNINNIGPALTSLAAARDTDKSKS